MEFFAEYSNTIILDIDKLSKEDLTKASHLANQSEFTYASFISPSGNGLKILVKIDTPKAEHKETFLLVQAHYEKLLSLSIDKSGKDLTRLCFYSSDENLYFNPEAKNFVTSSAVEMPLIENQSEPKTQNLEPKTDFDTIYNHCIKFTEKKVQYAEGSRNVFVHQLACNLNRKAIPLSAALGYILCDFNYDEKEVLQAVNSAYGNIHEFAKDEVVGKPKKPQTQNPNPQTSVVEEEDDDKPKPTQIDRLEKFLSERYIFRHNIVSGKLEFQYFGKRKWNVMNDFIENSMLRECLKARIRTNLSALRNLLNSDFCPLFNPFEDYFFNLPSYDEKTDYITQLANTITTTKQDLWQQCFKKWLVAMVGCVLDEKVINHTVIVFSGKQGLGKTTRERN